MHVDLLNPSRYLKSGELAPEGTTFTITRVVLEDLEREDGSVERKGIIFFSEIDKGWVMNVTNAKCLTAMWGQETDRWIKHRVTLVPEVVRVGAEQTTGIRVRGSPDLQQPVSITIKLRKKKAQVRNLVVTGAPTSSSSSSAPKPATPPPVSVRIADMCRVEGLTEQAAIIDFVKRVTGRASSKDLVEDDVAVVKAALEKRKAEAELF